MTSGVGAIEGYFHLLIEQTSSPVSHRIASMIVGGVLLPAGTLYQRTSIFIVLPYYY